MFTTVLSNVLMLLFYMLIGWLLGKTKKCMPQHAKSMSGMLIYALSPAMIINSFLQMEYTTESLVKIGKFFVLTLFLQVAFFLILYLIFNKKYTDAKYRILTVGGVLGNVGFFGMPVISGIFPNEPIVLCYSSIYVVSMNLLVFTIGIFMITGDKKYMSVKSAIMNPTTISMVVALPLYLLGIKLPGTMQSSIGLLAKMVTPMCMFILGIRLTTETARDVFGRPFVYLTCLFKLVLYPLFVFIVVKYLPFVDDIAKVSALVLAAAPAGAIIESLAELHECEQELSANVVLLTTIMSAVTMPIVLFLLLDVVGM